MLLVYLMDRFVWMLLVTVFTTLFLQQCGVMATPEYGSTSHPIVDTFEFKIEPDRQIYNYAIRDKRQSSITNDGNRSPVLDGIFNIPIATLSAVNDLIQSARPALNRIRETVQMASIQQRPDSYGHGNTGRQHPYAYPVQADGSSFKI